MAGNRLILVVSLLLLNLTGFSQTNRYVVYFTDKDQSPYSIQDPSQFLSDRAVERRINQHVEITIQDLPVNTTYIQQVKDMNNDVYFSSRWFNALLVQCDESAVPDIEALPFVERVEWVAPGERLNAGGRKGLFTYKVNAQNDPQLELHGIPELQVHGYLGEGMRIAVMDGGFVGVDTISAFNELISSDRIIFSKNLVTNAPSVFNGIGHGTNVLSIMAGVTADYQGISPKSEYMLFITEDGGSEYRIEEYNWAVAAEMADSAGVDLINTSLGYNLFDEPSFNYSYENMDGNTTLITRAANMAAERGILVVVSAGNEGANEWKYITSPADSPEALTVGAVNINEEPASFSSFGPTADGRIKPEVASLGVQTSLITTSGQIGKSNGTSFSTPIVCGFASLLWQKYPGLTSRQLKEYIISLTNSTEVVNDQVGYGLPYYDCVTGTDNPVENVISIYPLPVERGGTLTIGLNGKAMDQIMLYTMEGRLIYENNDVRQSQFNIIVPDLVSSMVLVRVVTGEKVIWRRLVVK